MQAQAAPIRVIDTTAIHRDREGGDRSAFADAESPPPWWLPVAAG